MSRQWCFLVPSDVRTVWLSVPLVQGRAGLLLSSSCFLECWDAIHFFKLLLSALCIPSHQVASGEEYLSLRQHSGVDLLPPILCLSYSLKGLQCRLGSSTMTQKNVSLGLRACRQHSRPIDNSSLPGPWNFRANLWSVQGDVLPGHSEPRVKTCQASNLPTTPPGSQHTYLVPFKQPSLSMLSPLDLMLKFQAHIFIIPLQLYTIERVSHPTAPRHLCHMTQVSGHAISCQ